MLFLTACDTHCETGADVLWEPTSDQYRLELTNRSPHMVELSLDGESLGAFCAGVDRAAVGNFPRETCSRIRVRFLDNPATMALDDCFADDSMPCRENNPDGVVCYDTRDSKRVEARVQQ